MWGFITGSPLQVDFYPNWQLSSSCYRQTDALLGDCKPSESSVAQDDICRGSLTGEMIFMGCCEVITQQEGEIFQSKKKSWLQRWDDAREGSPDLLGQAAKDTFSCRFEPVTVQWTWNWYKESKCGPLLEWLLLPIQLLAEINSELWSHFLGKKNWLTAPLLPCPPPASPAEVKTQKV